MLIPNNDIKMENLNVNEKKIHYCVFKNNAGAEVRMSVRIDTGEVEYDAYINDNWIPMSRSKTLAVTLGILNMEIDSGGYRRYNMPGDSPMLYDHGTSKIKLSAGTDIVYQKVEDAEIPPEMCICFWEGEVAVQDICLVRPLKDSKDIVEVLVFGDEYTEDYTNRILVKKYVEEDEE